MAYTGLADLLADLSRSPTLRTEYDKDKQKVWTEYQLSQEEKDLLGNKSTTRDDIEAYLGKQYADAQMINHW